MDSHIHNSNSCDVLYVGEQTAHVARLVAGLVQRGLRPAVLNGPRLIDQLKNEYAVEVAHIETAPVHLRGRYRWPWIRRWEIPLERAALKKMLKKANPRCIHMNYIKPEYALFADLGTLCPPVVASVWGSDLNRDAMNGSPQQKRKIVEVLKHADAATTASPVLLQRVRDLVPSKEESALHVIPWGIETHRFENPSLGDQANNWRDRLNIPRETIVVLAPRRINPRYSPERVMHAFARCQSCRNSVLVYKLMGDNAAIESRQKKKLTELARELGVQEQLRFAPPCPYQEIPALYHMAQVACFLLDKDGAPTTAFELMSAGVPLVAADIPGYQGMLRDGLNAHLVPLDDSQAAAEKLDYLVSHRQSIQPQIALAREWVRNHATNEQTIQKYLAIYEQVSRKPS